MCGRLRLARKIFTSHRWSVQPCVRPVYAVHMTAGHNALGGSGPGQKPAFEMHWHLWVVLIAGSTGSAYIPKPDGRQRPLAIAALEDKIVQRATAAVLNAIYVLGFSYGFRPGRGTHD